MPQSPLHPGTKVKPNDSDGDGANEMERMSLNDSQIPLHITPPPTETNITIATPWESLPIYQLFDPLPIELQVFKNVSVATFLQDVPEYITDIAVKMEANAAQIALKKFQYWHNAILPQPHYFGLDNEKLLLKPQGQNNGGTDMQEKLTITFDVLSKAKQPNPHVLPSLFIETRKEVLKDLANLVNSLENDTMRGNGNAGRVLLGPKGVGKSTFLQCFCIATSYVCKNVVVIFIDYGRCLDYKWKPVTPSQMLYLADSILKGEHMYNKNDPILDDLPKVLKRLSPDKRFLIVADEFDKVYKNEAKGRQIVAQFQALGGGTCGKATAVISGSGAALYDLCFPTMWTNNAQLKSAYPAYEANSLNGGRYKKQRFTPIREETKFIEVLQHIVESSKNSETKSSMKFFGEDLSGRLETILQEKNEKEVESLYYLTGGRFRTLQAVLQDQKQAAAELIRKFDENSGNAPFMALVEALVKKREQELEADPAKTVWDITWLEPDELVKYDKTDIFSLGDNSQLYVEVTEAGPRVTFDTLFVIDIYKAHNNIGTLNPQEARCLRHPFGQNGIDAEISVMRSLAQNFDKVPLPQVFLDQSMIRLSLLPCTLANREKIQEHLAAGVVVCGNQELLGEIVNNKQVTEDLTKGLTGELPINRLMKEHPDKSGADIIVFTATGKSLTAHRFQVKLGTKTKLTLKPATEITDKLTDGISKVKEMVIRLGIKSKLECKHYLITTQLIAKKAQKHFDDAKVIVLDREKMFNVWTDDIKKWDTDSKIFIYSKKL